MVNRRDFIGGAACGAAAVAAVGSAMRQRDVQAPLAPSMEAPPEPVVPEHARLSFAQQGEDILLFHVFSELLKVKAPTYLDIGAAYPVRGNNTYLLYTTDSRGVLVEPNPALVEELRRKRPDDTVIAAGVGVDAASEADYFVIQGNAMLNTFSREQVTRLQRERPGTTVERVMKMPLLDINALIQEHFGRAPDLLSTDVEGLDEAIVRALDLTRFRPGAICMETAAPPPSGQPSRLSRYMASNGYIARGASLYNTIYVDVRRR